MDVYFSLEELFTGVSKTYRFPTSPASHDKTAAEPNIHELIIKPGYKAGTKIRFRNAYADEDGVTGDIVFVVREKKHDRFQRIGHDLEIVHRISLSDAIAGAHVTITGIDGRDHHLECSDIVSPRTFKKIAGAGMPKSRRPGERGDLIVRFDIVFPSSLRKDTKERMRELLRRG